MFFYKRKQNQLIEFLAAISLINNNATKSQMNTFLDSLTIKEQEIAALFLLRKHELWARNFINNSVPLLIRLKKWVKV